MKTQFMKFTLAAGFALALAFTFSCSSGDDDNGGNGGNPSSGNPSGGKGNNISNYRTVLIGTQRWMAENLDYAVAGSKCYGNSEANCDKYGRLYDWSTAMALPSSCNSASCASQVNSPHQGICPDGWHIPSNEDWDRLMRYADGTSGTDSPYYSDTAGKYLKAASGWSGNGNGEDSHGFSALPGGHGSSDGSFYDAGNDGYWWSASEIDSIGAYYRDMRYGLKIALWDGDDKSYLFSVRCVQD